jgi:hypothetical protein
MAVQQDGPSVAVAPLGLSKEFVGVWHNASWGGHSPSVIHSPQAASFVTAFFQSARFCGHKSGKAVEIRIVGWGKKRNSPSGDLPVR